jgi:hypothetical protein
MADSAVVWRDLGAAASLTCGPLDGRVEIDGLGTRFTILKWRGSPASSHSVLSTSGPTTELSAVQFSDHYIRGSDLVLSIARRPPFQFDPKIYWRAVPHAQLGAAQIELVLSVQTDLLDSQPQWKVSSQAAETQVLHAASLSSDRFQPLPSQQQPFTFDHQQSSEHLFLFRSSRTGISYAEMIHPSDFVRATLITDGCLLESTLFPERLEKGVIRRGRICGWFIPAENDLQTAVELAQQFVNEPLPLTT